MTVEEFIRQYQEASLRLLGKEAPTSLLKTDYKFYEALVELTGGEGCVQFSVSPRNSGALTWEFKRK